MTVKAIRTASLVFLLFATGCSTPYQSARISEREHVWSLAYGGYSNTRIDANTESVAFNGNGFTDRRTVELYLLYRCAEVTHEAGFDYFVILDPSTDVNHSSVNTPAYLSANTALTGSSLATRATYFPGNTITFNFYGAQTLIKMFTGIKPDNLLVAYNADEVIEYMGPSVGKRDAPPVARSTAPRRVTLNPGTPLITGIGAQQTTPVAPAPTRDTPTMPAGAFQAHNADANF